MSKSRISPYRKYWKKWTPCNNEEYYDRWLFSFMSIHTTWRKNVDGFLAVKALGKDFTRKQLHAAIVEAKPGLTNMRTEAIWDFHQRFWNNPKIWYPQTGESFSDCRDRLAASTYGIGLTKTAFVLEMAFPLTCDVVCLDTHILQLLDYYRKDTPNRKTYHEMERLWVAECQKYDLPSPLVRHAYWDAKQGYPDTRYWSYVFERS